MRSVKIKTKELLDVLKTNREKHQADYEEATIGYRKAAIDELESILTLAKNNKPIRRTIRAVEPTNFVESYDTVIRMLEMSDDHVVELTIQEFNQYVEDKWHWKETFSNSTAMYNNR